MKSLRLTDSQWAYAQMHIAVLLYGFTGILGKEISISGVPLVWYRMLFTFVSLCFFPGMLAAVRKLTRYQLWQYAGIGVLMAIHWVTFFEAIKQSNVTVALSVLATTAFFTSLIEPLVFRRAIRWFEILMGVMVIGGLVMIFGFSGSDYYFGILIGLFSAAVVAAASVWNKVVVGKTPQVYAIVLVEFGAGVLFLSALLPLYQVSGWAYTSWIPSGYDLLLLLVLALVCTTFAYTLNMRALRQLTAFASNLLINLEPIYAILLAAWLYQEYEELDNRFYLGAFLVLLAVFTYPIFLRLERRKAAASER